MDHDAETAETAEIAARVRELDSDSTGEAEDAQYALIRLGPRVLDQLIAAVPGTGAFGQLCAIEVFNALKDPRPGEVLTDLLDSPDHVVRQWAAESLGELGIRAAVPRLSALYASLLTSGADPLDYEGEAVRRALTELGGRREVLPACAASLARRYGALQGGRAWPSPALAEATLDLAAHGQAVYGFGPWRIDGGGRAARSVSGIDWASEVDWGAPWPEVVAACREWALLAAEAAVSGPGPGSGPRPGSLSDSRPGSVLVARIDWVDASDLRSGAAR